MTDAANDGLRYPNTFGEFMALVAHWQRAREAVPRPGEHVGDVLLRTSHELDDAVVALRQVWAHAERGRALETPKALPSPGEPSQVQRDRAAHEIDRHLQELERLLRRIEMEQETRAARRDKSNYSGSRRYGIGDARADARHATSHLLAARHKLAGAAALLDMDIGPPQKATFAESTPAAVPTQQQAYDMGAKGAPATEGERILFEAWMRGHCWALCATWDGKQYIGDAEQGGDLDPRAMATRRLFAAWRDRAALARAAAHCRVEQVPLTADQRAALSVSREVSIPGSCGAPSPDTREKEAPRG